MEKFVDEVVRERHEALTDVMSLTREVDGLRAILAPLLDDPWREDDGISRCLHCGHQDNARVGLTPDGHYTLVWPDEGYGPALFHEPACLVLCKDELLGRA